MSPILRNDEVLWFSAIIPYVDEIIICFRPGIKNSEKVLDKIIRDTPFKNVQFLALTSFNAYHRINFTFPIKTPCGVFIKNSIQGAFKYWKNCNVLKTKLDTLIPDGSHVFTHNPWGEYGHEEHVQVYSILAKMQKKKELDLWHPNYGSTKTFSLIKK